MLLPAMIVFIVIVLVPAVQSFFTSLTDWDGISKSHFIGLKNYSDIFHSSNFYMALRNNLFWLLFGTIIPTAIGLLQANILVRGRIKYGNVFQMIFFLPQIVSVTVSCVIWVWIYDPINGPLNALLAAFGLGNLQQSWLGDPDLVMKSLLSVFVWLSYGFSTVVFSAAIQGVDPQLYEAATIDGAGRWRQFRNVTIPGILGTLNTVILLAIIGSFQVFDIIYIITKGGPGYSSYVLSYFIFSEGLITSHVGFASAVSITVAVMMFIISVVYNKLTERSDY